MICCRDVRPENAARRFNSPAPLLRKAQVQSVLTQREGGRILEVGSGCLRNALYLLRHGYVVSVLEVPDIENRFPREYARFRREGGTVYFRFPSSSIFDVVFSTFAIETICNRRERATLVRNVLKCLSDDGCLAVSFRGPADVVTAHAHGKPCGDGYITPNRTFVRSYSRPQLRSFLTRCGFKRLDFLHAADTDAPEILHAIAWKLR